MKVECLAGAVCLALVIVGGGQAKSASPSTASASTASVVTASVAPSALQPVRDLFRVGHQIMAAGIFTDAARCVAVNGQARAYYSLSCFDQALPAKLRRR